MLPLPEIFAGIGLIFIGVRTLAANLRQIAGPRLRRIISAGIRSAPRASLIGLLGGLATQSANGTAFIAVSMVSAGIIPVAPALPIVVWGAVGVTGKIVLAGINIDMWVMLVTGIVGMCFYFNLQHSPRWGNPVGAVLGLCLLFLGIHFVKVAASDLAADRTARDLLLLAQNWYPLGLVMGAAFGFLVQNGTTVAMIAASFAAGGLLAGEQSVLIAVGASLGAGLASYLEFANQAGDARLLAMFYVVSKLLGAALMAPLLLFEHYTGMPLLFAGFVAVTQQPALQTAMAYAATQCLAALPMTLMRVPILRLLRRGTWRNTQRSLTEPTFIFPAAAGEANAALDLVDREQARLLGQLPDLLTGLLPEAAADVTAKELHNAGRAVLGEVSGFLRLVTQEDGGGVAAFRIAACEGRNELLSGLFDAVYECAVELATARDDAMARGLIDGLHALLATAAEELSSSGGDIDLISELTFERTEMADDMRAGLLARTPPVAPEQRRALVRAAGMYETVVWLLHRYATTFRAGGAAITATKATPVLAVLPMA